MKKLKYLITEMSEMGDIGEVGTVYELLDSDSGQYKLVISPAQHEYEDACIELVRHTSNNLVLAANTDSYMNVSKRSIKGLIKKLQSVVDNWESYYKEEEAYEE